MEFSLDNLKKYIGNPIYGCERNYYEEGYVSKCQEIYHHFEFVISIRACSRKKSQKAL